MISRFIRIALVLGFALVASACSRRAAAPHVVHLRFWHAWGGNEGKYLDTLIQEFNASHPGIHVDGSYFTIGDKLLASIAGGKPPDIATVWSYMLTPMGESGAFIPLEKYLARDHIGPKDFLPHVWEYGLYGQHRWGVPTTLNAFAIFYNTKMIRAAGLDPKHPPRSTAELAAWAHRLNRKGSNGRIEAVGFVPTQTDMWIRNFGGRMFDAERERFVLNSPQDIAALDWMKSLVTDAGGMDAYRRFTASFGKLDSPQNPIFTGKMAMKEDGQWMIQFFRDYAPKVKYGLFPFPPEKEGQPSYTVMDGSFWAIPTGARHPDEAWTFISWLTAPEQIGRFCARLNNIPPRRTALDVPEFVRVRKDPKFDFFVRLIADGHAIPQEVTPVSEQLRDMLNNDSESVFNGSVSAKSMLENLNRRINFELERSRKFNGME